MDDDCQMPQTDDPLGATPPTDLAMAQEALDALEQTDQVSAQAVSRLGKALQYVYPLLMQLAGLRQAVAQAEGAEQRARNEAATMRREATNARHELQALEATRANLRDNMATNMAAEKRQYWDTIREQMDEELREIRLKDEALLAERRATVTTLEAEATALRQIIGDLTAQGDILRAANAELITALGRAT